jgi:DNA replication protein DnaC
VQAAIEQFRQKYKECQAAHVARHMILPYTRTEFNELMAAQANIAMASRGDFKPWLPDQNDTDTIDALYNAATGPVQKSVMLCGKYGCGKSIIMEAFVAVLNHCAIEQNKPLVASYKSIALARLLLNTDAATLRRRPLYIDEFGREPKTAKVWGNEGYTIAELLMERYDTGAVTYATSNMLPDLLATPEHYGPMLGDRLYQMFEIIIHRGESRRRL